jgi:hypothetical protein
MVRALGSKEKEGRRASGGVVEVGRGKGLKHLGTYLCFDN